MHARWLNGVVADWQRRHAARYGAEARWREIGTGLAAAEAGCVLLAGNSHAALLGTPRIAGLRSVNIAAGGLTARACAARFARLDAPVRAAAAVLIIGTNDIARRRHPERRATGRRFEDDVRRILAVFDAWAARVFVAALPPLGACQVERDPAAVADFSGRLARLCGEGGHDFFDPFASLRIPGSGLARAGLYDDGVHLADYPALAAEIDRCVGGALAGSGWPAAQPPAPPLDALAA